MQKLTLLLVKDFALKQKENISFLRNFIFLHCLTRDLHPLLEYFLPNGSINLCKRRYFVFM